MGKDGISGLVDWWINGGGGMGGIARMANGRGQNEILANGMDEKEARNRARMAGDGVKGVLQGRGAYK